MFIVTQNPTFKHAVKVSVPVDGGFKDQSFAASFRVIPIDDIGAFDLGSATGTADFLRAAIGELHDLVDDEKKPVPYNDQVREHMIGLPYVRQALIKSYFDGVGGAKKGN